MAFLFTRIPKTDWQSMYPEESWWFGIDAQTERYLYVRICGIEISITW